MKNLILKLSTRFKFVDRWIISFIELYCFTKRKKEIEHSFTEVLSVACQKDLERILTYSKLGELSGLSKPRVIAKPGRV